MGNRKKKTTMSVKEALEQKIRMKNGTEKKMFEEDRKGWVCLVCSTIVPGPSPDVLLSHSYGRKHRSNLRQMGGQSPIPSCTESDKLEDISQNSFIEKALKGIKEPMIGLKYLLEVLNLEDLNTRYYHCLLCMMAGDYANVINHIKGIAHKSLYLKTHFPTAYAALRVFRENPDSSKEWKRLVHKIVAKIEDTFGRSKPSLLERSKFESDRQFYINAVRNLTSHIEETPEHTFVDLVPKCPEGTVRPVPKAAGVEVHESSPDITEDMRKEWRKYIEDPEAYPRYKEEWGKYWTGKFKELEKAGRDPNNYDYKPEWKVFWTKRSLEIVIESRKDSAHPGCNKRSHDEDPQISSKRGRSRSPLTFSQKGIFPVHRRNSPPRPVEPPSLHWVPPPGLRDFPDQNRQRPGPPLRAFPRPLLPSISPPHRSGGPPLNFQRGEARPHLNGEPTSNFQRGEFPPYRNNGPHSSFRRDEAPPYRTEGLRGEDPPRRSEGPPPGFQRGEVPPRRSEGPPPGFQRGEAPPLRSEGAPPHVSKSEKCHTLTLLRLLTALEERLGSLGPKIMDLMSRALVMESEKPGSCESLVGENKILLMTAKEKLKGLMLAGLVTGKEKRAHKDAIWRIEQLVEGKDKTNRQDSDDEMIASDSQQFTRNANLPQSSSVQDAKKQTSSHDQKSFQTMARTVPQNLFKNQQSDLQNRSSQDAPFRNPGSERYSPTLSFEEIDSRPPRSGDFHSDIPPNDFRHGNTLHQNRSNENPADRQTTYNPRFSPPSNLALNPGGSKPWNQHLNSPRFFDHPPATSMGNIAQSPADRLPYSRFPQSNFERDGAPNMRYTEKLLMCDSWETESSEELERRISAFRAQMTARGLMGASGYGPMSKPPFSDRRRDEEDRRGSNRGRRYKNNWNL